jgi:hypothetical protein
MELESGTPSAEKNGENLSILFGGCTMNALRIFALLIVVFALVFSATAQDNDLVDPEMYVLYFVDESSICLRASDGSGQVSAQRGIVLFATGITPDGEWIRVRFDEEIDNSRWAATDNLDTVEGFGDEIENLPQVTLPFNSANLANCFNNGNTTSGGNTNAGGNTSGSNQVSGNTILIGSTTYIFQNVTINNGMTIQESYAGHGTIINGPTVAGGDVAFALFSFDDTGLTAVSHQPAGVQFGAYEGNHPNVIANQFVAGACGFSTGCSAVRVFIRINGGIYEGFPL